MSFFHLGNLNHAAGKKKRKKSFRKKEKKKGKGTAGPPRCPDAANLNSYTRAPVKKRREKGEKRKKTLTKGGKQKGGQRPS